MKHFTLILLMMACFCSSSFATTTSSAANSPTSGISTTRTSRLQSRMIEKFQHKVTKYSKSKAIRAFDADSILDKDAKWWLRTWLVCWAIGLAFSILAAISVYGLWYIGYLFWTLGTIAAIIWLLKIFEAL